MYTYKNKIYMGSKTKKSKTAYLLESHSVSKLCLGSSALPFNKILLEPSQIVQKLDCVGINLVGRNLHKCNGDIYISIPFPKSETSNIQQNNGNKYKSILSIISYRNMKRWGIVLGKSDQSRGSVAQAWRSFLYCRLPRRTSQPLGLFGSCLLRSDFWNGSD